MSEQARDMATASTSSPGENLALVLCHSIIPLSRLPHFELWWELHRQDRLGYAAVTNSLRISGPNVAKISFPIVGHPRSLLHVICVLLASGTVSVWRGAGPLGL